MRYALLDESGAISNVIALDEGSDWQPPKGFYVISDKEGFAEIGGIYDGKEFHPAPVIEPEPTKPTERELIKALGQKMEKQQAAFDEKIAAFEVRLSKIEGGKPAEAIEAASVEAQKG